MGQRGDQGKPMTQWASLSLARLHLSFGHQQQAIVALQEAMRSAQQQEDNACLAYALLLLGQAHEGAGADTWADVPVPGEEGAPTGDSDSTPLLPPQHVYTTDFCHEL